MVANSHHNAQYHIKMSSYCFDFLSHMRFYTVHFGELLCARLGRFLMSEWLRKGMGRGSNGYGSCLSYFGTMCCLLLMEIKRKEVDLIIVFRENSWWDEWFLTSFS